MEKEECEASPEKEGACGGSGVKKLSHPTFEECEYKDIVKETHDSNIPVKEPDQQDFGGVVDMKNDYNLKSDTTKVEEIPEDFPPREVKSDSTRVEEILEDLSPHGACSKFTGQEFPITIEESNIKVEEAEDVKPIIVESSSKVTLKRKSDSLALISAYNISSDSDNELNISQSFTKPQDPIIIDSETDSDSESGSILNIESDASNESSQSSDDEARGDDLTKKKGKSAGGAASNKLLSCLDLGDLPPIKDLQISVKEEECLPFGKVHSIVETLVVIESLHDVPALNLESVLFTKTGEPLGEVFDVFGPVKRPYYTIRFNSQEDIMKKSLSIGALVYCAPKTKYTQYVFIHQLAKLKGSDASWKNDLEPPPEFLDYSDDEQERQAKKAIREAKLKAKAQKIIDLDAPPMKILTFEERMNQRNTLRNQMFIQNPPAENRQNDWFRCGNVSRESAGTSNSGGLIRSPGFTPTFQRVVSPRTSSTFFSPNRAGMSAPLAGGFTNPLTFSSSPGLTPCGFLASRPPFSVNGPRFPGQQFNGQPNPLFGSPPPGPQFSQSPHSGNQFGQTPPRFGSPPGNSAFGMPSSPGNGFPPFSRQPPMFPPQYSKPFLPTPAPQYASRSPSYQLGSAIYPPVPLPSRPMAAPSPPFMPPRPFPFPPNRPSQPNQNHNNPNNMFSNNSPFSQFRHFKQN